MKKPVLLKVKELENIKENKSFLLKQYGFESIYDAKKSLGGNAESVYLDMFNDYNKNIERVNKNYRKIHLKKMEDYLSYKSVRVFKINKYAELFEGDFEGVEQKYFSKETNENEWNYMTILYENYIKRFEGKTIKIIYEVNGDIILDVNEDLTFKKGLYKGISNWWKNQGFKLFQVTSSIMIFDTNPNGKVLIYEENKVIKSAVKVAQYFKEGEKNCLLYPVLNWIDDVIDNCKTKKTAQNYMSIKNKVNKLIESETERGVFEEKLQDIADNLQVSFTIEKPLCDIKFIQALSNKKALKHFKYINTRFNHVELGKIENNYVYTNNYNIVDRKTLLEMKNELISKNIHFTYKKDLHNISSITTLEGTYHLSNDFNEYTNQFEIDTGLINCKIDDVDDKELSLFVKNGTHYNSTIDFKDVNDYKQYIKPKDNLHQREETPELITHYRNRRDILEQKSLKELTNVEGIEKAYIKYKLRKHDEWVCDRLKERKAKIDDIEKRNILKHADMEKAYIKYKLSKYYEGFLGKITDFRPTDKIVNTGLYRIENLKLAKGLLRQYNNKMKIFMNNNIYTSAELKFLSDNGATYDITCGAWGIEALDFDMDTEEFNMKYDGVKGYAKYIGKCDSHRINKKYYTYSYNKQDAENIANNTTGEVTKVENEICVSYEKKHNYHLGHITAFITAYQRLNVLEQLFSMDINSIVRVCVDGIYYLGDEVKYLNAFRFKDDKTLENWGDKFYISNLSKNTGENYYADTREHYAKQLFKGAGGNGKTHFNLLDQGLVKPLYVAPSWKLATKKRNDYETYSNVWYYIVTNDIEEISKIKRFHNVLIIDEVSMMTEEMKQNIFTSFSDMKLIFCGDIGYQAPPFNNLEDKSKLELINLRKKLQNAKTDNEKDIILSWIRHYTNKITEMNETGFDNVIEMKQNYRFKCNKLKSLIGEIRKFISLGVHSKIINEYILEQLSNRIVNNDYVKNNYKINDMILCRSHETKDIYTEMFKHLNKWSILENTREHKNGDIIISDEKPNCKCEIRHAYTVHSIQGETAEHNLYINMDNYFDSRILYTAISRAKTLDQIYLVKN
jgi:hypothetical protein